MRDKTPLPPPATPPRPALYIPVAGFILVGIVALLVGFVSNFWVGATLIAIAVSLSVAVAVWVSRRFDALVAALALVVFWLPFHLTVTRFNISPQELATYGIALTAAVSDRRGIRRWLGSVLDSIPVAARFAMVLFAMAALQSVLRIPHPSLLLVLQDLRGIFVFPALLALLVAYVIRTRSCERTLFTVFFWGGVLLAIYALTLRLWGVEVANGAVAGRLGAESSFLSDWHPNNLSLYLGFTLAFAPAMFLASRRDTLPHRRLTWSGAAVIGGTLLMLVAVWLTYSRGALAALVLAIVLALFFFVFSGTLRQRITSAGILVAGALAFVAFILVKGVGALGRYADLLNPSTLSSDPNVQFRTQLYNRAIKIAIEHPFSGIGLGVFSTGSSVPFSPHNTYLDLWVSIGLIGMLAFVGLVLLGLIAVVRIARHLRGSAISVELALALGLGAALVTFLVQAFVESFDVSPRIAPAVWICALAAQAVWFRMVRERDAEMAQQAHGTPAVLNEAKPVANGSPEHGAALPKPVAAASSARVSSSRWSRGPRSRVPLDDADEQPRAAPVTAVLPAVELPWNFTTGQMPAIGNFYEEVTDFKMPAIRRDGSNRPGSPDRVQSAAPADGQPGAPAPEQNGAVPDDESATAEPEPSAAEQLLQRAPTSYIWNQIYSLWFFAVNFILSVIITRGLSPKEFAVYSILSTIVSVLLFLFAFGFEDVATVFLPRVFSLRGQGAAGKLVRRLTIWRLVVMCGVGALVAVGLSSAVPAVQSVGLFPKHFDQSVAGFMGLRPLLMGAYLAGSSVVALQTAFFVALLKSRVTLIIGGISQLVIVLLTLPLLRVGFGIDGIFGVQAVVAWVTAAIYMIELVPFLRARAGTTAPAGERGEMGKLMFNAWLTNVTNGALGKQMDIMLMAFFAISLVNIADYNLAYQLGSIVSVILISGLGGVGMASMSAALAAGGRARLASMWSASLMLQILLAVPLQIACFVLADQVIVVVYGPQYAGAASLLRIYLAFSILGRFIGGGANQSALYVISRQRAVLFARWAGLVINVLLDVIFIQVYGPAGALFATGFSQAWVGIIEYLALRPHIPLKFPGDFALRLTFITCVPAIVLLWWTPEGFLGLVARSIVFAVLFAIGLVTIKLGNADDLTDMINANPKLRKLVSAVASKLPAALTGRGRTSVASSAG
jgi:O-antigen/teichoic acid export membrane protein/O-antigen ligase